MPANPATGLRAITWYRTGGTCDSFHEPASTAECAALMADIRRRGIPWFVLGAGSNSLVSDRHFAGAVISCRRLLRLERDGNRVTVGAGLENTGLAEFCLTHSLAGAAWMNRLPGQLGATVRMNARCYDGEISQIVHSLEAVTPSGEVLKLPAAGLFRGYKDTVFMENRQIITGITLELTPGEPAAIQEKMDFCEKDRISKHQFDHPSCGCVFKNPYDAGVPAGMLLEAAGAGKFTEGKAEVNPYHANFVFNKGESADRIIQLTLRMRRQVYEAFGVWLEYEMEILGELSEELRGKVREQQPASFQEDKLAPLRRKFQSKTSGSDQA